MPNTNLIDNLINFVQNKGLIDPNRPPAFNEPFYENWMIEKIKRMGLKCGDTLTIEGRIGDEDFSETGILIDDMFIGIHLLTKGNKVWKNGSNNVLTSMAYISNITKVKDAPEGFNCKEVNPNYITEEERQELIKSYEDNEAVLKISSDVLSEFNEAYPNLQFDKYHVLSMEMMLYLPFSNTKIKAAKINVVKKDGQSINIPDTRIRNIYPNRCWYNVCGTGKHSDLLFVPFKTFEELEDIKYISCEWEIEVENEQGFSVLGITIPTFERNPNGLNIYAVKQELTMLEVHEESLHKRTVHSGSIYIDYDFVGVLYNEEFILPISEQIDINPLDIVMLLHNNNLEEVVASLTKEENGRTEIYIREEIIEGRSNTYSNWDTKYVERKKERLDFSKFLDE